MVVVVSSDFRFFLEFRWFYFSAFFLLILRTSSILLRLELRTLCILPVLVYL